VDVHENSSANNKNSITTFPVSGVKYNKSLANKILDQTLDSTPSKKDDSSLHNDDNREHDAHIQCKQNIQDALQSFICNKKMSQDKMCIVDIICEHFMCIRDGRAKANNYIPPICWLPEDQELEKAGSSIFSLKSLKLWT
jgi:hypothetical protein